MTSLFENTLGTGLAPCLAYQKKNIQKKEDKNRYRTIALEGNHRENFSQENLFQEEETKYSRLVQAVNNLFENGYKYAETVYNDI